MPDNIGNNSSQYNVLCAGMTRSASTWLYNAARLLVTHNLDTEINYGWVGDFKQLPLQSNSIIKLHSYNSELVRHSSHILYSYRDIRDVLGSMKRAWNKEPSIEMADRLVSLFRRWTSEADFIVKYDDILADKNQVIMRLAETLGLNNPNPQLIIDEISNMSYSSEGPKSVHNQINLFHKSHITDGRSNSWHGHVDPKLIAEIERRHQSWFEECNLLEETTDINRSLSI